MERDPVYRWIDAIIHQRFEPRRGRETSRALEALGATLAQFRDACLSDE